MAIRFIDEAVYNKISNWVKDPNMRILKPNETARLFQIQSDNTNDKPLTLPLIALSRDSEIEIQAINKKPLSFSGARKDVVGGKAQILDAIPIQVNYQLDIYTKRYDEGDEYLRNFIFNLVNHPKLEVKFSYNGLDFTHNGNIRIEPTVSDTSDIPQHLFSGQFTRWTINFNVDDCYLFSFPIKDVPLIQSTEDTIKNEDATTDSTEAFDIEY